MKIFQILQLKSFKKKAQHEELNKWGVKWYEEYGWVVSVSSSAIFEFESQPVFQWKIIKQSLQFDIMTKTYFVEDDFNGWHHHANNSIPSLYPEQSTLSSALLMFAPEASLLLYILQSIYPSLFNWGVLFKLNVISNPADKEVPGCPVISDGTIFDSSLPPLPEQYIPEETQKI